MHDSASPCADEVVDARRGSFMYDSGSPRIDEIEIVDARLAASLIASHQMTTCASSWI
jgi:hypothetical protein